jgi:hypothetical protein
MAGFPPVNWLECAGELTRRAEMKNLCLPIEKEGQPTAGLVSDVLLSKENFCPPKRCLDLINDTIVLGQKELKPL